MADIRINALATTATTPASDDFLALDGTAQGTRKILATNIANNVTDVVFGTSGPSAKSSIAARAARQGLVFNGTTIAENVALPAFGTSDFTFSAWVYQPTLAAAYLCSSTGGADDVFMYLSGTGTFQWWSNGVARATSSAGSISAGKWTLLTATRTGGTTTLYANGVSVGSGADTQNITSSINRLGGRSNSTNILNGTLIPVVYNRALSAAEVVALYEAGVPAGTDYNTASNTSIITGANSDFSSDTGYWSKTGTASIGSGVCTLPGVSSIYRSGLTTVGKRYRVTVTLSGGSVTITNADVVTYGTISGAGTGSLEFTAQTTSAIQIVNYTGSITIDNVLLVPVGLLLAPDAGQAGGGLTWYDTSGNAANITLPASGVTWNVPSSRVLGGNWTTSGNLTVSGTGTNLFGGGSRDAFVIESDTAGNGAFASAKNAAANDYEPLSLIGETITLKYRSGVNSSTAGLTLTSTGTTLAGNLTVSGTGASTVNGNLLITGTTNYTRIRRDDTIIDFTNAAQSAYANAQIIANNLHLKGNNGTGIYVNSSGNGLFGTTTDSSNGRIQLATHTTSAGGIGFGTDTALFRSSAGILSIGDGTSTRGLIINGAAANAQVLLFQQAGTEVARIGLSASTSLLFATGANVTALTLDSSQNATFAGAITSSRPYQDISSGLSNIYVYSTDTATQDKGGTIQLGGAYTGTTTTTFGGIRGSKESTTAGETGGQLEFFTRSNGGAMARRAYISSTGAATFAGAVTVNGATASGINASGSFDWIASRANTSSSASYQYKTGATLNWYHGLRGLANNNWYLFNNATSANTLIFDAATDAATFAGAIAIGNTVNTVSPTSPNRTITMVIGGVTYYLHAKTTND